MTVVMAVDERYAANGRPLRAEAAASETQRENAANYAMTNKSTNKGGLR